jgi:hypothetical protein
MKQATNGLWENGDVARSHFRTFEFCSQAKDRRTLRLDIDAIAREKLPLLASARAQIFPVAWHRYAVHDRKHPLATREECAIF